MQALDQGAKLVVFDDCKALALNDWYWQYWSGETRMTTNDFVEKESLGAFLAHAKLKQAPASYFHSHPDLRPHCSS